MTRVGNLAKAYLGSGVWGKPHVRGVLVRGGHDVSHASAVGPEATDTALKNEVTEVIQHRRGVFRDAVERGMARQTKKRGRRTLVVDAPLPGGIGGDWGPITATRGQRFGTQGIRMAEGLRQRMPETYKNVYRHERAHAAPRKPMSRIVRLKRDPGKLAREEARADAAKTSSGRMSSGYRSLAMENRRTPGTWDQGEEYLGMASRLLERGVAKSRDDVYTAGTVGGALAAGGGLLTRRIGRDYHLPAQARYDAADARRGESYERLQQAKAPFDRNGRPRGPKGPNGQAGAFKPVKPAKEILEHAARDFARDDAKMAPAARELAARKVTGGKLMSRGGKVALGGAAVAAGSALLGELDRPKRKARVIRKPVTSPVKPPKPADPARGRDLEYSFVGSLPKADEWLEKPVAARSAGEQAAWRRSEEAVAARKRVFGGRDR